MILPEFCNIAAGNLADGDTIPQDIRLYRELEKGEYLLRVNGHSMEPSIPDGSVVIMKKYTIPPIPTDGRRPRWVLGNG